MSAPGLRDPFGAKPAQVRGPLITEGSYRNGKREIFKNGRWQPVNVIHAGQQAMVNGVMRTADGRGNWMDPKDPGKYNHETGEFDRATYGTYKVDENRTPVKLKVEDQTKPPVVTEPTTLVTETLPVGPPTPSADPRNAAYLTARGKLTKDSTPEEIKKVEDIGMTAWAKANKGLAAMVKPGQSGYDQSQDVLGNSTQDQRDTASDMMVMGVDPEESMALAKGGIVEVDIDGSGVGPARISPQGFKDDAMTALLTNFGNQNVEPIVEGISIPTTTNYAAAFNQADTPDLQSMINMGDQLGNYGIESPLFSQGQKFKDLFQNAMLGK